MKVVWRGPVPELTAEEQQAIEARRRAFDAYVLRLVRVWGVDEGTLRLDHMSFWTGCYCHFKVAGNDVDFRKGDGNFLVQLYRGPKALNRVVLRCSAQGGSAQMQRFETFGSNPRHQSYQEKERQFTERYLPLFVRNCWLSGLPVDVSAHEKDEWRRSFSPEDIEAWNLI